MAEGKPEYQEIIEDKTREITKPPSLYKVILLNDDYTTMDFVVDVLETIFHKTKQEATLIMLNVHQKGSGLCGVYTKDIAQTRVHKVHERARKNNFPLKCVMEKE
ncbi:ATP-dependent Clp protease adaptor protein ClpS [Candidatus Magnetoovum chiemensis]|nr:ATP-dependent Clp protease adaptor protein ClpS [Candidatus Magnetoovum chiemensis]